jgi:hypothetical protein
VRRNLLRSPPRRQAIASREAVSRRSGDLLIAKELDVSDLHVEVIDLVNNRGEGEIGLGFFIAAFSALKKAPRLLLCWCSETYLGLTCEQGLPTQLEALLPNFGADDWSGG